MKGQYRNLGTLANPSTANWDDLMRWGERPYHSGRGMMWDEFERHLYLRVRGVFPRVRNRPTSHHIPIAPKLHLPDAQLRASSGELGKCAEAARRRQSAVLSPSQREGLGLERRGRGCGLVYVCIAGGRRGTRARAAVRPYQHIL